MADLDVAAFNRDGFAVIEQLITAADVDELRTAYEDILSRPARLPGDRLLGGRTRQVMMPSVAHPTFRTNAALDAAREAAAPLLGAPLFVYDMLIYKPPGHEHSTPWHQDVAYSQRPVAPRGTRIPANTYVQFWVALDDVDEQKGCMHFAPGYHNRPSLEHSVVGGAPEDDGRLLAITELTELDLSKVRSAPLRAGGATAHSYCTPHYTPPNRSTEPRRAYIFTLGSKGIEELAR